MRMPKECHEKSLSYYNLVYICIKGKHGIHICIRDKTRRIAKIYDITYIVYSASLSMTHIFFVELYPNPYKSGPSSNLTMKPNLTQKPKLTLNPKLNL